MKFLRGLPIVTIVVVLFLALRYGSKIKEKLNESAPSLGKLVADPAETA